MPIQNVFGASSLRRHPGRWLTTVLLGAGLVLTASPAGAQVPATSGSHGSGSHGGGSHSTGSHGGSHGTGWYDGRVALWERGDRAKVDGVEYTWPAKRTWTYDGAVCPDGDVKKTDTRHSPETVEIVAPEGKVIDSYCVKSASEPAGGGARIVEVDEPVDRLTIAYPRNGKASGISHYSVCFRDAKPGEKPRDTRDRRDEQPTQPAPAEQPVATEPAPAATPDAPRTAAATPDEAPSPTPAAEPAPEPATLPEAGTPSPSATPVAAVAVTLSETPSPSAEPRRLAATDEGTDVTADAPGAEELALTGAEVIGVVVAAVVLIALGALGIHLSRRREDASQH